MRLIWLNLSSAFPCRRRFLPFMCGVGHSHEYWLDAFVDSANLLPMLGDFYTRGRPCDVRYLGRRGAALETFLARVMARFASYRADVMVQRLVGTLWAGRPFLTRSRLSLDIQRLALTQLDTGVRRAIVSQLCRRRKWRHASCGAGAWRFTQVNRSLDAFV